MQVLYIMLYYAYIILHLKYLLRNNYEMNTINCIMKCIFM